MREAHEDIIPAAPGWHVKYVIFDEVENVGDGGDLDASLEQPSRLPIVAWRVDAPDIYPITPDADFNSHVFRGTDLFVWAMTAPDGRVLNLEGQDENFAPTDEGASAQLRLSYIIRKNIKKFERESKAAKAGAP